MGSDPLRFNLARPFMTTLRVVFWLVILLSGFIANSTLASAQTKSLKLYYIHTGEKAEIIYKKNGRYLASGLKKVNWHLRDWRRNEPTKMDPKLLDLVWEAYRQSGSKGYITVISGYRSPASNNLLRKRGRGVAKNSQHTLGKALDFYLPDVKLKKLRDIGLKLQVGGVGYYPTSGSPFVHLDVGSVRHWPRMSRKELVSVFPDGKTMHVPTDGKPLARYEQAVAAYNARSASGKLVPEGKPTSKQLNFFQRLAQGTKDDEADDEENNTAPAPRAVTATTKVAAPAPAPEPTPEPAVETGTQFASLPSTIPVPTLAPRGENLSTGSEIAIATAAVGTPSEPEVEIPVEPVIEDTQETVLASLSIPVPQRRPQLAAETVLAALETEQAPETQTSELALVAPTPVNNVGTNIAVFSPQEIEDLRAAARPTTTTLALDAQPANNGDITLAALETDGLPVSTASIPVPLKNPVESTTAQNVMSEPVAPLGIEPETKSTGKIATPLQNPLAKTEPSSETVIAELQKTAETTPIVLASLPLPIRNPKIEQIPAVETAVVAEPAKQAEPALAQRTISLDSLSAPQENTSSIGKWALSSETTIADLADVQAPAYGRNVIRQVPGVILVQSFTPQLFGPGKNNFKGKAVTAMRFARLQIQ